MNDVYSHYIGHQWLTGFHPVIPQWTNEYMRVTYRNMSEGLVTELWAT